MERKGKEDEWEEGSVIEPVGEKARRISYTVGYMDGDEML